jgi:hypothetical protein
MGSRSLATLALTLAMAVPAALPGAAGAVPAVGCGKVKVHHRHYSVRAHVFSCKSARHWTVAWLKHRSHPSGWTCRSFSRRITRVRFVCENPATASRNDGPQSYSASR